MNINRPVRFTGTNEEREANRATHCFIGDEARCMECDCRMFGTYADWPCLADVPRENVGPDAPPVSALEAIVRSF